jgi:Ca2+-binding EF-hand superfamily protein
MDQSKILIYINTLLVFYDSRKEDFKIDYELFKERFLSMFESINRFTKVQEDEYRTKLIRKLTKHKDELNFSLKNYDKNNTGFITFLQLRKILDTIKINLQDELIEYLIYLMKSFKHEKNASLEDLKYAVLKKFILECC